MNCSLKILICLFLLYNTGSVFSQQVINGGFEDTNEFNFETYWEIGFGFNCFDPPFPEFATIVNDSNTGNNAAKLSSDMCYPEELLTPGTIYTNDNEPNSPSFGYEYHERPANLNYYYKYLPAINGEISFVKIMLFKFDYSNYTVSEVVGVGESSIIESPSYTLQTVPIDYYSGSVPDYLHILFSTSDGFSYYQNQPFYNPNVDNVNSIGTILLVDDVYLSGGSIGTDNFLFSNNIRVYPNPMYDFLTVKSDSLDIYSIKIYDVLGKLRMKKEDSFSNILISDIDRGLYFILIETNKGLIAKKLIKK